MPSGIDNPPQGASDLAQAFGTALSGLELLLFCGAPRVWLAWSEDHRPAVEVSGRHHWGLPAVTSADTSNHCVIWASQPSNTCVFLAGSAAFQHSSVLDSQGSDRLFLFPFTDSNSSILLHFFFLNETNAVLSCQKTQARDSLPGAAESHSHPHPSLLLPHSAPHLRDALGRFVAWRTAAEMGPGSFHLPT